MSQTPDRNQRDQHAQDDEVDEQLDNQLDEQLLARVRGADPAMSLPALSQDALDVLLQATTSTPRTSVTSAGRAATSAHTAPTTTAGTTTASTIEAATPQSVVVSSLAEARRRRRRWTGAAGLGLAAAAAGVIALGGALPGLSGTPGGRPQVTALQAAPSTGVIDSCAPINATFLAGRDLAFQGTVTEVRPVTGGEVVVLEVERVFRGDVGQRVEVSAPGAGSTVDGTVALAQGGDYLVAAFDGTVAGCGATGAVSPELAALYEQAFGGGS